MFLGSHVLPAPESAWCIWKFRLVQSWSLGIVTYRQAVTAEYDVHKMLRTIASEYVTEWYRLDAQTAVDAVTEFHSRRTA